MISIIQPYKSVEVTKLTSVLQCITWLLSSPLQWTTRLFNKFWEGYTTVIGSLPHHGLDLINDQVEIIHIRDRQKSKPCQVGRPLPGDTGVGKPSYIHRSQALDFWQVVNLPGLWLIVHRALTMPLDLVSELCTLLNYSSLPPILGIVWFFSGWGWWCILLL